ncbi:hypothetical protein [Candidatus Albibeggiatoa sp. nov. BB20]
MIYILLTIALVLLAIAVSVPPFVLISGLFSSNKEVETSDQANVANANKA